MCRSLPVTTTTETCQTTLHSAPSSTQMLIKHLILEIKTLPPTVSYKSPAVSAVDYCLMLRVYLLLHSPDSPICINDVWSNLLLPLSHTPVLWLSVVCLHSNWPSLVSLISIVIQWGWLLMEWTGNCDHCGHFPPRSQVILCGYCAIIHNNRISLYNPFNPPTSGLTPTAAPLCVCKAQE